MADGRSIRDQVKSTNTCKASTCITSFRIFQQPNQVTWTNSASVRQRNMLCLLLWEVLQIIRKRFGYVILLQERSEEFGTTDVCPVARPAPSGRSGWWTLGYNLTNCFLCSSAGAEWVQRHSHKKPHQHGHCAGPQSRRHLCLPGAGTHRGGLRALQWQDVLPDHDRR